MFSYPEGAAKQRQERLKVMESRAKGQRAMAYILHHTPSPMSRVKKDITVAHMNGISLSEFIYGLEKSHSSMMRQAGITPKKVEDLIEETHRPFSGKYADLGKPLPTLNIPSGMSVESMLHARGIMVHKYVPFPNSDELTNGTARLEKRKIPYGYDPISGIVRLDSGNDLPIGVELEITYEMNFFSSKPLRGYPAPKCTPEQAARAFNKIRTRKK